jgi:transposase, IS30 family
MAHLNYEDRLKIQKMLTENYSFKAIGRELNKNCSTVSKEIRNHLTFKKSGSWGHVFNDCIKRSSCNSRDLCDKYDCTQTFCKNCKFCTSVCIEYEKEICSNLLKPPYVCNGCYKKSKCTLEKRLYDARYAHNEYVYVRSESRSGFNISEAEMQYINEIVSPLLRKGQSLHHICTTHADTIMRSEKTLYTYIDNKCLSVDNMAHPRKVKYRPRRKKRMLKVDKKCFLGRTYQDYLNFMEKHPDTLVVQMDSVEGIKGGAVLLTLHFVTSEFMLAFKREHNDSKSVTEIFERLYEKLEASAFSKLFSIILTDRGSEFSNPSAIEFDKSGNKRCKVFYCDPNAPFQKGAAENNHELIIRIIPKGKDIGIYSQDQISLMMSHINSYARKKLNDHSPQETFSFLFGNKYFKEFEQSKILPDEIVLLPSLLK